MDPYRVAPSTKDADVGDGEVAVLEQVQVEQGYLIRSAWTTNPIIRATPSTKLVTTGMLVKLPVVPTSESE
jgi:hypothetical protein